MESYVFDDILNFSETPYLLKTLNSEPQKKIISSVFRSGSLIYSSYESYNGHLSEEELFNKVKECHERSKNGIQALFNLSQKYANSRDVGRRLLIVRALLKHKMFKEATNEIAAILHLDPNLSDGYFYLGQIWSELEQLAQAGKCFEKAIELNPNFADYHFHLGKTYLAQQSCKNAIDALINATNLNPYYSDAHYYLGLAYLKNALSKQDYDFARDVEGNSLRAFQKAAQINPNYKNEPFAMGEEALRNATLQEAYDRFEEARQRESGRDSQGFILDFYVRYLNVESSLSLKETQDYIQRLQALTKKFPHYADLHHELGLAYMILAQGINQNAVRSFQTALGINPNYSTAQKMLKALTEKQNQIL